MNAISILKTDHRKFLRLFEEIDATQDNQPDERKLNLKKLELILKLHMLSEEKIFYKEAKKHPAFVEIIDKSYQSHHLVDIGLKELDLISYTRSDWKPKFQAIRDSILQHMDQEENWLFPEIEKTLGTEQLEIIGEKIERLRQELFQ